MEEIYNRHYILTDERNRITDGWSDGIFPDRSNPAAICINEQGGYQFRLKFADGTLSEENQPLYEWGYMIPLYAYEDGAVRARTQEEIDADIAALPKPETKPSTDDILNALLGVTE